MALVEAAPFPTGPYSGVPYQGIGPYQAASYPEREYQSRIVQDGITQWNVQREAARLRKIQEQKEVREMLDKYWPWSDGVPQPRGLRNLRLEGIFPNKDLMKAKRAVSPLGLGRPGGGAPIITHSGKRAIRTKEDPLLRYQWSKDLRKAVDNTLRYKTDSKKREEYKKQLDVQVAERKYREELEKRDDLAFHRRSFLKTPPWGKPGPGGTVWRPPGNIGINFLKSLGWSTENTLKKLNRDSGEYLDSIRKDYEDFKKMCSQPPRKVNINDIKISPRCENQDPCKADDKNKTRIPSAVGRRKLSPLIRKNVNGEELVPLLAKQRAVPMKVPLNTTDVTRGNPDIRKAGNPEYLQELTNQMYSRQQQLKEMKNNEMEMVRQHFHTLDAFWGRPGHGAPRTVIKKGCLDSLLYNCSLKAR